MGSNRRDGRRRRRRKDKRKEEKGEREKKKEKREEMKGLGFEEEIFCRGKDKEEIIFPKPRVWAILSVLGTGVEAAGPSRAI